MNDPLPGFIFCLVAGPCSLALGRWLAGDHPYGPMKNVFTFILCFFGAMAVMLGGPTFGVLSLVYYGFMSAETSWVIGGTVFLCLMFIGMIEPSSPFR